MKEKWGRPAPVQAYRLLWSCHSRMGRLMARRLREYGASEAQYGLLRCVPQNGGITASELARAILRGKSNLTTLIARTERAGLISTEADPEDGRRRVITLTTRGREAQEQLVPPVYDFIGNLFACFTEEEMEQLLSFLRRLDQHLNVHGGRDAAASGLRTTPPTRSGEQGGPNGAASGLRTSPATRSGEQDGPDAAAEGSRITLPTRRGEQGGPNGAASGLRRRASTGNSKQGGLRGRGAIRQTAEDTGRKGSTG